MNGLSRTPYNDLTLRKRHIAVETEGGLTVMKA